MKKKFRKIVLSKETLGRLDGEQMAKVAGATELFCTSRGPVTHCDDCGPDDTGYCTWPPGAYC